MNAAENAAAVILKLMASIGTPMAVGTGAIREHCSF